MPCCYRWNLLVLLTVACWCGANPECSGETASGPLAEYVAADDPSFKWEKIREGRIGQTEYAELILTSQKWKGIVWKHQLFVLKPSTVNPENRQALLIIAGGRWKDEFLDPAAKVDAPREGLLFARVAEQLQTPVAVLLQVPFQPMFDGLVEDEIIALTFDKYLRSEDPQWPLLSPMVKGAVRGMDAVQQYCREAWDTQIDSFTVTGGSKRGWTTWLVGAVDRRATAIAPMVIDTLKMGPQMVHQLDAWGKYSEQIEDYTALGIQERMNTPAGLALRKIVDPFGYRQFLRQSKLIMIGTNDRYWPLDALNLYWDELLGPKYILYVPNNGHGLKDFARVIGSLSAMHKAAAGGRPLPDLSWNYTENGKELVVRADSDPPPRTWNLWSAKSNSRDFRSAKWSSQGSDAADQLERSVPFPESGFRAVFAEAVYDDGGLPYYLSTNVRILSPEGVVTPREIRPTAPAAAP